jgi:hypothetical protein
MATSLIRQVDNWAKSYNGAGIRGLVVMRDVINHIAEHRDTDAALRLLSKVDDATRSAFGRVIRARFGDDADGKPVVKAKKDATHTSGWRIVLPKQLPRLSNSTTITWGIVNDAVSAKAAFTNAAMHKALRVQWKEETPTKEFDYKAAAKRLIKSLDEREANVYFLIEEIKRQVKAETALIVVEENLPDNVKEIAA